MTKEEERVEEEETTNGFWNVGVDEGKKDAEFRIIESKDGGGEDGNAGGPPRFSSSSSSPSSSLSPTSPSKRSKDRSICFMSASMEESRANLGVRSSNGRVVGWVYESA